MPLRDVLTALLVIVIWGTNFIAIKVGVNEIPPFLLGGLRFVFVALPAVFFVARPKIELRFVLGYAATICLGQFGLLFLAIYMGMPAGLASLVLQVQAFFTVLIAAFVIKEVVRPYHMLGILVAIFGLVMLYPDADTAVSIPFISFMFTILAAFCWACGNVVLKCAGSVNMMSMVVWGAVFPPIPFFALSLIFEGRELIAASFLELSWRGVASVAYLSFISTLIGYVLWGKLLVKHPVGKIAPLSLLIPIVALLCADLFLDEYLIFQQWVGGAVIMLGLAINLFGGHWYIFIKKNFAGKTK